jgi:predicted O-methyltransferase YrrM
MEVERHLRELHVMGRKSRTMLRELSKSVSDAQLEGGYLNSLNALPLRYPLFFGRWSIDGITAKSILDTIVEKRPRVVLELGGGTSTVLIAAALQAVDLPETRHIAVDHLQEFLDATARNVSLQHLSRAVEYWCCPLLPEDDKAAPQWYGGLPERLGSTQIDLLIVDGPPASLHSQARKPALEVLAPYLAPGAVVILDDALREDELKIVEKWAQDMPGVTVELTSFGKGCARLKLP